MVANIHHFASDDQHAARGCTQLNAAHAQALTAGAQKITCKSIFEVSRRPFWPTFRVQCSRLFPSSMLE
jgi:hypothetical protein